MDDANLARGLESDSADDLVAAFRAAAGRVRDAQAEVARKREAELLASAATRAAVEQLETERAALDLAEGRLQRVRVKPSPDAVAADLRQEARLIDNGVIETGKAFAVVAVKHGKAPRIIDRDAQHAHPGDYWAKAAPKRRLWLPWGRQ